MEHIFHFTAAVAATAASKTDGKRQLSSFRLIVGTLCIVRVGFVVRILLLASAAAAAVATVVE